MQFQNRKRHMIDFLFPIALFFIFTLSALMVVLFAARIYQSSVENSSRNDTARTALSYVAEKIHQNDISDSITLGSFDNCDSLVIRQDYNGDSYTTYIYVHDGSLKELFIKDGANAAASNGKSILDVTSFSMTQLNDNLLKFNCIDKNGHSASIIVGLESE